MPYTRPDLDALRLAGAQAVAALTAADSADAADAAYRAFDEAARHFGTMANLAYVRHTLDTTDPFYDAEMTAVDELSPLAAEVAQQVSQAVTASPYRPALEQRYGALMLRNLDIDQRTFSPAVIADLQEENQLSTAYDKLLASAQIPFEGKPRTLAQMTPFKQSPDDAVRRAAWQADGQFYTAHAAELDDLYARLVAVRDRMARTLGYDDFIGLGYDRMTRNCYTPADVARFREAVARYVTPAADKLYRAQAQRTGCAYPLSYADAALAFRTGNARPAGTADDLLRQGRAMYHELSAETAAFIDTLFDGELLDVLTRKGKAGGGYCIDLPDYGLPFIFANFNGTAGDVEVITHEAGHAFAAYMARDVQPSDNQSPTTDACEIHSMSMEFFGWRWADGFFGRDAAKFRYSHLAGAITFLPYGAAVDEFQHSVYAHPDWTPEERHDEWRRLTAKYLPWLALDGSPFYGEGRAWQRQAHIYASPFYYIDYCLAQTVALQFWALIQRDEADAWARYRRLVDAAGRQSFTELVATAGLTSPFDEAALRTVTDQAMAWLDDPRHAVPA